VDVAVVVGPTSRDLVLTVSTLPGPGESVAARGRREVLGGKGALQAVAFARLGLTPRLVSAVGDDEVAARLAEDLRAEGVDVEALRHRAGVSTGLITEILDADGPRFVLDIPDATRLGVADIRRAAAAFTGADAVVISLLEPLQTVVAAIERARAVGAPVVLDGGVDREDIGSLAEASVLRADAVEAEQLAGRALPDRSTTATAGHELVDTGVPVVVLEVRGEGNLVAWRDAEGLIATRVIPLPEGAEAVDTTGAGDAFVAALTAALVAGVGPVEAVGQATEVAARAVAHVGGRPPAQSSSGCPIDRTGSPPP
jgi:ribokinase